MFGVDVGAIKTATIKLNGTILAEWNTIPSGQIHHDMIKEGMPPNNNDSNYITIGGADKIDRFSIEDGALLNIKSIKKVHFNFRYAGENYITSPGLEFSLYINSVLIGPFLCGVDTNLIKTDGQIEFDGLNVSKNDWMTGREIKIKSLGSVDPIDPPIPYNPPI